MVMEIFEKKEGKNFIETYMKKIWKDNINKKLIEEKQNLQILPILMIFLEGKYGKRESYRKYCEGPWESISRPTYFKKINKLVESDYLENESKGKGKDAYCLSDKAIELFIKYQKYFKEILPEIEDLISTSPLYHSRFKLLFTK